MCREETARRLRDAEQRQEEAPDEARAEEARCLQVIQGLNNSGTIVQFAVWICQCNVTMGPSISDAQFWDIALHNKAALWKMNWNKWGSTWNKLTHVRAQFQRNLSKGNIPSV